MKRNVTTKPRAVFQYYGGKHILADWIIQYFPAHTNYVEPYGGAASVLLAKERSELEVYNDLYGHIQNFFKVLRDDSGELIRRIILTPFSRAEFLQSRELLDTESLDAVERARLFYVLIRQGRISGKGGWRFNIDASKAFSTAVQQWQKIDNLTLAAARLKGVQLECDEAINIILRYDTLETLFYVDPPYLASTRTTPNIYALEMSESEHITLAHHLHNVKGKVLLSGYDSDLYKALYSDWQKVTTDTVKDSGNRATECLWISPSAMQQRTHATLF